MQIIDGIPVCGSPVDPKALEQIQNCRRFVGGAALNADHHAGYSIPIGGVLWSQAMISPSAVGYDIGCGNKAVKTDARREDVAKDIKKIMDEVASKVSFGLGRTSNWKLDHPVFESPTWKVVRGLRDPDLVGIDQKARAQLGTVGGGNHYVDIFYDEEGWVWVGVHFGSRGLGHKLATSFLEASGAHSSHMDADPVMLHDRSALGEDYLACMNLAGDYAYAGRDAVCSVVVSILAAEAKEEVHNHHNFAWREKGPDGLDYWVMRKGATPAYPGQKSFVGATMGEPSVIIEGVDSEESRQLFYSTVHGAGRVMSRTLARGKRHWNSGDLVLDESGQPKQIGLVTPDMMKAWIKEAKVEVRGGDVDESPHCYKRLGQVLQEQGPTIRVLHTLTPMGVAMAGPEVKDPFRD
jgi:tRNA-splicing ligase RtcB (3'-phosphate/5'-hydroxy nucleic acid ligase)